MVLQTQNGRRKFEVMDQNWNFIMSMLSNDIVSNSTVLLTGNNSTLAPYECEGIASTIRHLLKNTTIYEVWDGIKIEPLIDPDDRVIKKLGKKVQLLTEKRSIFLGRFVEFLERNSELEIVT